MLKSHLRSGRSRNNTSDPSAFRDDPTTVVGPRAVNGGGAVHHQVYDHELVCGQGIAKHSKTWASQNGACPVGACAAAVRGGRHPAGAAQPALLCAVQVRGPGCRGCRGRKASEKTEQGRVASGSTEQRGAVGLLASFSMITWRLG